MERPPERIHRGENVVIQKCKVQAHPMDKARAFSAQAIGFLIDAGIPPLPVSYAVAYVYASGDSEPVRAAIDQQRAGGRELDEVFLLDIYERYISADPFTELHGLGHDLEGLLQSLMQSVGDAGKGAHTYGEALRQGIDDLHAEATPKSLGEIAAGIRRATQDEVQRNDQLQQQLATTRAETERLKGELEQRSRDALLDPLTGLFNRRAMDAQFEMFMALDGGSPLSLLMIDIDHFKSINDNYGHAVGDAVIRNVAEVIRKCIRGDDYAVRFGGEEFLVMLPNTETVGAATVAESIRSRIASLRLKRRSDNFTIAPFTASVGVATRSCNDTQDSLLQRADQALYQSKGGGRNKVSCLAA
jgi:diguanylate cyclase